MKTVETFYSIPGFQHFQAHNACQSTTNLLLSWCLILWAWVWINNVSNLSLSHSFFWIFIFFFIFFVSFFFSVVIMRVILLLMVCWSWSRKMSMEGCLLLGVVLSEMLRRTCGCTWSPHILHLCCHGCKWHLHVGYHVTKDVGILLLLLLLLLLWGNAPHHCRDIREKIRNLRHSMHSWYSRLLLLCSICTGRTEHLECCGSCSIGVPSSSSSCSGRMMYILLLLA
jgi:hypothetical protein